MNFSRRKFLRLGLAGAASLYLPRPSFAQHSGHGSGSTPGLEAFVDPLPIPAVLRPRASLARDDYKITMKMGTAKCHRDLPATSIYGYEGLFPGPTIKARINRAVRITQVNHLPGMMSHGTTAMTEHMPAVHLHGAVVKPDSDGHPDDGIPMDGQRIYDYPNRQRACHMWYHDHTHGMTGHNVYMGLAGHYILEDVRERLLRLPTGPYEVPLVLQDRSFDADGQLVYNLDDMALQTGVFGDVVCVNGKIQPYFNVEARKYRFRLLNGSNARQYLLKLSNDAPLVQIGTDGGLLQRPKSLSTINVAPAERIDFIIDFSKFQVGTQITLMNISGEMRTINLMQFRLTKAARDTAVIPAFLNAWDDLPEPTIKRQFTLNRVPIAGELKWVINGLAFESPERPAQIPKPKLNAVEHWRFINPTNHPHPMHLHLVQFQIVNIGGEPQDASDFGWKDVIVIPPASEVTLAARFSGFLGKYVFHCHNLEHEDFAMMSEFEVTA